jgi:hypothetical protein
VKVWKSNFGGFLCFAPVGRRLLNNTSQDTARQVVRNIHPLKIVADCLVMPMPFGLNKNYLNVVAT